MRVITHIDCCSNLRHARASRSTARDPLNPRRAKHAPSLISLFRRGQSPGRTGARPKPGRPLVVDPYDAVGRYWRITMHHPTPLSLSALVFAAASLAACANDATNPARMIAPVFSFVYDAFVSA